MQVAQALAGLARVLLGTARVVSGAGQAPLAAAHLTDLVCDDC